MARQACPLALVAALAASSAAHAGPEHLDGVPAAAAMPVGSFESAGIAVFVRAHEARRHPGGVLGTPAERLAFSPAAKDLVLDGGGWAGPLDVELPSATGSTGGVRWVAPSDRPARPGALAHDGGDPASPFAKSGLLELHPTPDLELPVSQRATIGVFGEANRIEPTDIRNSTTRATRELGAGVTLQYRFGQ